MDNQLRKKWLKDFHVLHKIKVPKPLQNFSILVLGLVVLTAIALSFIPWVQTSYGEGRVTTLNPSGRPQIISAPVKGRLHAWFVHEGQKVKQGDPILEIVDNDPNYIERLGFELTAVEKKLEVAKAAAETARLDYVRRESLYKQGLNSRHEYEKAKIAYAEYRAKEAAAAASLAKVQTRKSRQETQMLRAPADGMIVQMRSSDEATFVKQGDTLAYFVPANSIPVAEIYVRGLDAPLIRPGDHVRLQFEGWPAVQFSGWPAISVGSFGGIVAAVDPSATQNGKFRVLIKQDPAEAWPNRNFLRYGTRAQGWVLMRTVRAGYELWRQLNSFPPLYPEGIKPDSMVVHYGQAHAK